MARTKYLRVEDGKRLGIDNYPNAGPNPNISGMKKQYWGMDALVVKCGTYAYNVSSNPSIYYNEAY